MKMLFLMLAFISVKSYSQKSALESLWVGEHNEYFKADSNIIYFETLSKRFGNKQIGRQYLLVGDTMRILSDNQQKENCNFILDTMQRGALTLTPLNESARTLTAQIVQTGTKERLNFRDNKKVYTDTIKFEKIMFHSTNCYGYCPRMSVVIDSSKKMIFDGERQTFKEGFFYATVPDSLYNVLIDLLRVAELDKIECSNLRNADAPTYTTEIHYNGKFKYLKSFMPPFVTDNLKQYLLTIAEKVPLVAGRGYSYEIEFNCK